MTPLLAGLAALLLGIGALLRSPWARAPLSLVLLAVLGVQLAREAWLLPGVLAALGAGLLWLPRERLRLYGAALASLLCLGASLAHGRLRHDTQACTLQPPEPRAPTQPLPESAPPGGRVDLFAQPVQVSGQAQAPRSLAVEQSWGQGAQVAVQAPFPVAFVEIQVQAAEPTTLRVFPSGSGDFTEVERGQAELQLAVSAGSQTLRADIEEILLGGWNGAQALSGLSLQLEGPGEIGEVRLLAPEARLEQPVSQVQAQVQGVLRPSWAVQAGAEVRLVAPSTGVLTFYTASPGGGSAQLVLAGEEIVRRSGPGWFRHEVPVVVGQELVFRSEASSSFFGSPQILSPAKAAPNVVVYLVDTLRADHVGFWGGAATPNMDRLAQEGAVFSWALSTGSWTKPTIPTLMSGVHPGTHQVGALSNTDRVPPDLLLVQERFAQGGWATASFSASPLGSTLSGLDRGFDVALPPAYWEVDRSAAQTPPDSALIQELLDWLDAQQRPGFAYVHTLDVHQYYLRGGVEDRSHANYLDAIQQADAQLGALISALEARPEPTLLVLVSDHGESFHDHGLWSHGTGLALSQTHVPWVFWRSDGALAPQTHTQPVSLMDLAPTLLDWMGLPPLPEAEGVSRVPLMQGLGMEQQAQVSSLFRFTWKPDAPQQHTLVGPGGRKLWWTGERLLAFDLEADPCEARSRVLQDDPALQAWLARQPQDAQRFTERHGQVAGTLSPQEEERLRLLGYIE